MAFFDRFFKSSPPLTIDQKMDALKEYSIDQLVETINSEEATVLKHAAIRQLPFGAALLDLATNTSNTPFETHACKRVGELLDDNTLTVEALSKHVSDQALLIRLCGYSCNASTALVKQIDDEDLLLELAKTSATTAMRQAAAEKINSHEHLLALQKVAKNKDKSVSKIVKDKLDERKQIEIQKNKIDSEASVLCARLEQLFKRDVDGSFRSQKLQINKSWQALTGAVTETRQEQFAKAMALCQTKIEEYEAEVQKQQKLEEAERLAKTQLLESIKELQLFIAALFSSEAITDQSSQLEALKKTYNNARLSAKDKGVSTHKEERYFDALMDNAYPLIQKLQESGSLSSLLMGLEQAKAQTLLPEGETIKSAILAIIGHAKVLRDISSPGIVVSSQDAVNKWDEFVRARKQAIIALKDEGFGLIRRGLGAVNNGQVRRARAIFNDLEKCIEGMESLPKQLEIKYDEFKTAIQTLGDWHEFSVTPKKEALIESMHGLVASTLHPKDLAEKIKSLQEQWRELSKGGQQDDSALWNQFQEAGKLAYEPCKAYFAEMANEREVNAQKRRELNEQLQQYLDGCDWDNANWKDVEKTLRVAREAWQSFWPVARKDNKELLARFDKITDAIYQKISEEYERNAHKKQMIVDKAKQLTENTDIGDAIESAKKLQSEWQTIGRAKPRKDQELWKEFRAQCDCIFEKRKQESEAERQAQNAEKTAAEEILSKLDDILALSGPEFFAAKTDVDTLTDAFKNLGELPRGHAKALNHKFQQFSEDFQNKIKFERKQAQLSVWSEIFSTNQHVCNLELLTARNETTDDVMQVLREAFSQAEKWPNTILMNLQSRLDECGNYSLDSRDEYAYRLRLLCVRSEIANNRATPEEDKGLRMEYQMAQLQHGLGAHNSPDDNSTEALMSSWVSVPAPVETDYQELEKRFRDALGFE